MDELLVIHLDEPLQKGKGNRDGLVQQIITYVKDGRTVTRKQWVRSEFADHAKKNEEEKKKTLLKEQEREEQSRARKIAEENEKARNADKRAHKKVMERKAEMEESAGVSTQGVGKQHISEYKKRLEKLKKQEKEQKKKQNSKNKAHSKKEEKKRTAFGQQESARKQNKEEENLITRPNI